MGKFSKGPSIDFPKGGSGKMYGKGGTRPAESGQSGKSDQSGDGKKFPNGGSGKMFGKQSAGKALSGQSGKGG